MPKAYVTLYDATSAIQSAGPVTISEKTDGAVSLDMERWVWGAEHVQRRPLALIRRIAANWAFDGADRDYDGWDDAMSVSFRIRPQAP